MGIFSDSKGRNLQVLSLQSVQRESLGNPLQRGGRIRAEQVINGVSYGPAPIKWPYYKIYKWVTGVKKP